MDKRTIIFILAFSGIILAQQVETPFYYNQTPTYNTTISLIVNSTNVPNLQNVSIECTLPDGINYINNYIGSGLYNSSNTFLGNFSINETQTWNCTSSSKNSSDTSYNTTSFLVACPSNESIEFNNQCYIPISLYIDQNMTYYDIGDWLTIWAANSNSSQMCSMWIFKANGSSINMNYSIVRKQYYVYYQVEQSQELLVAQAYDCSGNSTGYGELLLTYNPQPVTPSMWQALLVDIGYAVAVGGIILVIIILGVTVGPMVVGFIFGSFMDNT